MKGVWDRHEQTMKQAFKLTRREARVAREVIKGLTNPEIAIRYGVSKETVNKQLDKVYRKAKVKSRGELAAALLVRM